MARKLMRRGDLGWGLAGQHHDEGRKRGGRGRHADSEHQFDQGLLVHRAALPIRHPNGEVLLRVPAFRNRTVSKDFS